MKPSYLLFFVLVVFPFGGMLLAQDEAPCSQTVTGEVRDRISNELLPGALAVLQDNQGNIILSQTVAGDGVFFFEVACEKEYVLEISMNEFTTEKKGFTTDNRSDVLLKTSVFLDKGKIDFVTDPVSDVKSEDVTDITSEPSVIITEIAAPKKMASVTFSKENPVVDDNSNEESTEEVEVVKSEIVDKASEIQEKESKKAIGIVNEDIDPIYFDLGSSYFNRKAKADLLKAVSFMKAHPYITIQCIAHSDAQGTTEYNKWLSDRRAKRTVDYMVENGIEPDRISWKSYGDTKLTNGCAQGVTCTEEQHAKNRRTEFVVVKM